MKQTCTGWKRLKQLALGKGRYNVWDKNKLHGMQNGKKVLVNHKRKMNKIKKESWMEGNMAEWPSVPQLGTPAYSCSLVYVQLVSLTDRKIC